MSEFDELSCVRDEALRKIGRNVVNFQKMEGMLKILASEGTAEGSLSDLAKSQQRRAKLISRQPMGQLVSNFLEFVYSRNGSETSRDVESREDSFSLTFRIESNPELAAMHQEALKLVVEERNSLIHKRLANFDSNSLDSCRLFCEELDAQHQRVWPEFEALASIVKLFRESQEELRDCIESDAFEADWESANNDA